MLRPKKNSYKEFDNEKKFLRLKNSAPPHNFSNGPSLTGTNQPRPQGFSLKGKSPGDEVGEQIYDTHCIV